MTNESRVMQSFKDNEPQITAFVDVIVPHMSSPAKRRKCEALSTFLDYAESMHCQDMQEVASFREIRRRQEVKVRKTLMDAIDEETLCHERFGNLCITLDSLSEVSLGIKILQRHGYICFKDKKKNTLKVKLNIGKQNIDS